MSSRATVYGNLGFNERVFFLAYGGSERLYTLRALGSEGYIRVLRTLINPRSIKKVVYAHGSISIHHVSVGISSFSSYFSFGNISNVYETISSS